jgi:hypothetical protein
MKIELFTQGPKSLKLLPILYNESTHNILALVGNANKLSSCMCIFFGV